MTFGTTLAVVVCHRIVFSVFTMLYDLISWWDAVEKKVQCVHSC
jgi:hypothetical protein